MIMDGCMWLYLRLVVGYIGGYIFRTPYWVGVENDYIMANKVRSVKLRVLGLYWEYRSILGIKSKSKVSEIDFESGLK